MKATEPPVTVSGEFQCSVSALWQAISNPDEMRAWYFDNIPAFEAKVGFTTQFPVHNEGRKFTHRWEVTDVVPEKKLSYKWSYDEYPGDAEIHFLLSGNSPAQLQVTMDVLADFDDDIPEFRYESCQGGWDYFIGESLRNYLEADKSN